MSIFIYIPVYLPFCLPLSLYISICLSFSYLPTLYMSIFIYIPIYLPLSIFICLPLSHLSTLYHVHLYLHTYLFINLSISHAILGPVYFTALINSPHCFSPHSHTSPHMSAEAMMGSVCDGAGSCYSTHAYRGGVLGPHRIASRWVRLGLADVTVQEMCVTYRTGD